MANGLYLRESHITMIFDSEIVGSMTSSEIRKIPAWVFNSEPMEYIENYKYLGCWVNEFGKNQKLLNPSRQVLDDHLAES